MPRVKLDNRMKEIRALTGYSMTEIREIALLDYIDSFDFPKAYEQKEKQRRDLIRYAVKKHGKNAARVLSENGMPVKLSENDFYKQCLLQEQFKDLQQPV